MENNAGFLKIYNYIAEAFAHINLSEYKMRLLWVIIRKTWGWNKDEDFISFTQFEKATGIDRGNAHPALLRLEEKKIIIINREGHINKYRVNTNVNEWVYKEEQNVIPTDNIVPGNNIISPNNTPLFQKITPSLSQGTITIETKKTIKQNTNNNISSKETVSSTPSNKQTPIQRLVTYYKELYKTKFGVEPTISSMSWGKWGRLLKIKFDQNFTLEEILALLQIFSKMKDSDTDKLGFDLGIFFSDSIFNKIRAASGKTITMSNGDKYAKY